MTHQKTQEQVQKMYTEFPLWTALVTPFAADSEAGRIDEQALEKLLRQQEAAKNGALILGSTGESLNLTLEEKKWVVEKAVSMNLSIPLMVGVGGAQIGQTLEWISWLNDRAIDSLLLVTPLYAKPGRQGQTQWFKKLLDLANHSCILYNVPSRAGISLNHETVVDLVDHKNFDGIKEASGSVDEFKKYRTNAPKEKGMFLFCGDDGLMPEFSAAGGNGLISVASNVWPEQTHRYVQENLSGVFSSDQTSEQVRVLWKQASDSLFIASNPVPAKRLLAERKDIGSKDARLPLSADDLQSASILMEMDAQIQAWK